MCASNPHRQLLEAPLSTVTWFPTILPANLLGPTLLAWWFDELRQPWTQRATVWLESLAWPDPCTRRASYIPSWMCWARKWNWLIRWFPLWLLCLTVLRSTRSTSMLFMLFATLLCKTLFIIVSLSIFFWLMFF